LSSGAPGTGILAVVSASALLGMLLLVAGAGLLTVGLLGWTRRLPRNRFAGIRTPATLRSEAAFSVANRVAAPPVLAAGVVGAAGGALAFGTSGPAFTVVVGVAGAGTVGLLIAGGLLGHRVAAAMPPPKGGCAGCTCSGRSCAPN
jgi:uncharacterized membrane protein